MFLEECKDKVPAVTSVGQPIVDLLIDRRVYGLVLLAQLKRGDSFQSENKYGVCCPSYIFWDFGI